MQDMQLSGKVGMNKLIWIIALFLLALPLVSASPYSGNQSFLFNNSLIIYHPSNNVSQENSTNLRTAVVTSDPLFDITKNSTTFDGTDKLSFTNIVQYNTNPNLSFFCWSNLTGNGRVNFFGGRRVDSVNGEWQMIFNDGDDAYGVYWWGTGGASTSTSTRTSITQTNGYELYGFTLTRNSSTVQTAIAYINATKTSTATSGGYSALVSTPISIGDNGLNDDTQYLIGGMKGCILINGSMTDEQILWYYEQGEDFKLINVTETTADTTPPIINGSANISLTNIKINDLVNFTFNWTDETAGSYGNITWNYTSKLYVNFSGLSGTSGQFSNTTKVSCGRGCVINVTGYITDSSGNVKQNSTLFTIQNTAPPSTSIVNVSDKNWNTNLTLNITPIIDDDSDTINYVWYMDSKNPPTSVVQNSTSTRFITNWTNETIWYINVTTFDLFDSGISTSLNWNGTLDTTTPVWQEPFIANGTFFRISENRTYNCTDINLFEVNTTTYRTSASNNIFSSVNFTNLTPTRTSREINLSIDVSIGDVTINITRWCGDTKNRERRFDNLKHSKTSDNITIQINDTANSIQCNISMGTENPSGNWLPSTSTLGLQTYVQDIGGRTTGVYADYYKFSSSIILPNENFVGSVKFECNARIVEVYDNLANHLLIGSSREKISIDAQDLKDNGFDTTTWTEDAKTFHWRINKGSNTYTQGQRVTFDPRIDNLNIVEDSSIVEIDTGSPTISFANISINGLRANQTFINQNYFNLSINASDKNLNSTLVYVNGIRNVSGLFTASNTTLNITLNLTDANYTLTLETNDSAGNKQNFTLFYAIDGTAPTLTNALNRTTSGSISIIEGNDVNISIQINDSYIKDINISHNATGNWINHSLTSTGNGTYSLIISKNNLTAEEVIGWKADACDLAGNCQDPIYTFKVGSITTGSGSSSSSGGITSSITIPQTLVNPFGTEPINNICPEKQQLLDNRCYPCDPAIGYLKFNPNDRSVICVKCEEGFELKNKECILKPPISIKSSITEFIDKYALKISQIFNTTNPMIGYAVIFISIISIFAYGYDFIKKK